jgi:hypothetical protein
VTDRVPSDSDAVATHRTHLREVGRTGRSRVPLPEAVDVAVGDVIRLSLAGETYHAQVETGLDGDPDVRGAFSNARLARTDGEGDDHLRAWLDDVGLEPGDPVLVDAVTPGFMYGLRRPGERVIYEAGDPPQSSLADIARDLDG